LNEFKRFKRNIKPVYFVIKPARQVAIYLAWKYCRTSYTLTAIGKKNGISISGVTSARDKAMIVVQNNKELKKKQAR
jgi:hypothetical protein